MIRGLELDSIAWAVLFVGILLEKKKLVITSKITALSQDISLSCQIFVVLAGQALQAPMFSIHHATSSSSIYPRYPRG